MYSTIVFGLVGKALSFLIFGPIVIIALVAYIVVSKTKK